MVRPLARSVHVPVRNRWYWSLLVVLGALIAPAVLAQMAPEDSVFERVGREAELEPGAETAQLEALLLGLTDLGRDPSWVGLLYDETRDPDALRPTWYVIRSDSTVWVRSPEGESAVLDPYIVTKLGDYVGDETGYSEAQAEGFGWGSYDGRFHIYAARGFRPWVAMALLAYLVVGTVSVLAWLAWALRRSQARARALAESRRRLADARETERLRIAREIHDGPVQDLHALRLHLGAGALADSVDPDVIGIIDSLRAIGENLRPPSLDTMGLDVAVRSFIGRFERTFPFIKTDLVIDGEKPALDPAAALTLFRVIQESMNNAAQHGDPESVSVLLVYGAEAVQVVVEDDGAGFDVPADVGSPQASPEGHYGLIGMAERAESVGGTLRILRGERGGIRVAFEIPGARAFADPVQID